jgi:hypothetical protein
VLLILHASGGAFLAGLVTAGWMLATRRNDPIPCFLDMCMSEITLTTVYVTGAYFVATVGAALAVAATEITGSVATRVRSSLALAGPPVMLGLLLGAG